MIKGFLRNKRAEGETLVDSPVIFVVLNIMFFSILLLFIFKQSTGAFVYEQAYAKEISLLLDSARPGMTIYVNLTKGIEAAKKNEWDVNDIVNIDDENNSVSIKLARRGGYKTYFFTDYGFDYKIEKEYLVMNIRDKTEEEKLKNKLRIIMKDYFDKKYDIDFASREQTDVEKAILFAKTHLIGNRKCLCGDKCIDYAKYITEASQNNKIDDSLLLLSLMMQESSCENLKCNPSGYCGLMQISIKTSGYADARININEGAKELRKKYELFNHDSCLVNTECKKLFFNLCKRGECDARCGNTNQCEYQFMGCGDINVYYSGWSAALRGYNGWGCGKDDKGNPIYAQDFYVEEVLDRYIQLKNNLGENA